MSSQVTEPESMGGEGFSLLVLRGPGVFGRVTVDYEVGTLLAVHLHGLAFCNVIRLLQVIHLLA